MLNLFGVKIGYTEAFCPACAIRWRNVGTHIFAQRRVLCAEHKTRLVEMMSRQDDETDKYALLPWTAFVKKAR